jgi:acyl-CoA thioesterase FadM
VTGRMVHVFVDPKTMEKQPIPAQMRSALSRYASAATPS